MKRLWQCNQDGKSCALCLSLDGRLEGDGWSAANGREIDLWYRNEDGEWVRRKSLQPKLYGSPPLHPNCRCMIVVVGDDDVVA